MSEPKLFTGYAIYRILTRIFPRKIDYRIQPEEFFYMFFAWIHLRKVIGTEPLPELMGTLPRLSELANKATFGQSFDRMKKKYRVFYVLHRFAYDLWGQQTIRDAMVFARDLIDIYEAPLIAILEMFFEVSSKTGQKEYQ